MNSKQHSNLSGGDTTTRELLEQRAREQDHMLHNELFRKLMDRYVDVLGELNRKIDEVTLLSITDPLTQAYNRLFFREQLNKELEMARRYDHRLSVIMFDLDHFKDVNDTYDHEAGDKVLAQVSEMTKKRIRTADIFARWGGEEFIILLPETGKDQALILAEDLRRNFAETPFPPAGRVTCSFGVSEFTPAMDASALCRKADDALYKAKKAGRNCVKDSA